MCAKRLLWLMKIMPVGVMAKKDGLINSWIPCFAIILLVTIECQATPLVLNETQDIYTPGTSMFVLEDPGGALTINDVLKPGFATQFTPCQEERPNFGYTKSAYWVRVTIHNQGMQQDLWLIELLFANIHYVDFYRPAPNGSDYLTVKTGVMRPVHTRDVAHHRFFFRLPLAPGDTQTVYLRVQNGASMTLAMRLLTPEAYARNIRGEYVFIGILLASNVMLGFYSAFLWHSLRDRLFLYYAFSMVGVTCLFLAYSGIGFYYLWAGIPAINRYAVFWAGGLYGIIVLQFSILFLEVTRRQAVAFAIFRFLQLAMFAVMTASLIIDYGRVIRFFNLIAIGGCLAAASIGVMFRVKGFRPARYYLLVMASGGIWIILLPLVRSGLMPSTLYTEHAVEIGSLGFSFVWAFALMKRVTFLRQEQEQTFAALQDSEQKFRDIAKNTPGMVYQFRVRQDGSTYFSYASPRANELFGLPDDLSSQKWELGSLLHPDDRDTFFASITQAIDTRSDWNYEGRLLMDDGCVKWFQGISSPTRVDDELVFNGILMDITGRKQAEEALKASEEKYRILVENAAEGVLVIQEDVIRFVNPRGLDILGRSKNEILGCSGLEFIYPEDQQRLHEMHVKRMRGEPVPHEYDYRILHKTGQVRWLHANTVRIEWAGRPAALVLVTDITERKQVEEALQESEEKFRTLAEQSPNMIFINKGGTVVYANKQAEELMGYTKEEYYATDFDFITLIAPEYKDLIIVNFRKHRKGEELNPYEYALITKTGKRIEAIVMTKLISYEGESAILGIVIDITERKQAEEQIRKLNAELEERVKQRTIELETANKELKSFAYVVSHDLKTPLRGISHLAHWLVDDYTEAFDEQGKNMVSLLIGRVQRMDDLIDGILQYSRVGRVVGEEVQIDLNALVRDVIDSLSPPEHIQVAIENDLPDIVGDKIRIVQVFQNLIGNAVKFMDKPEGKITVSCFDDGSLWIFKVADNGPGIDRKYHEKIFQIFQTLHPRDEHESTGIGLTLVKKIVELYGGTIWVESIPGQGSTFSFTWSKKCKT